MNIVSGANAQGKTSLLEAVFVLAMGKSFRTSTLTEVVRHGGEAFALAGIVFRGGVEHAITARSAADAPARTLDGRMARLQDTLLCLAAVAITASGLEIFRGGPEARRRFLDRGIVATWPETLAIYRDYTRALRQKNMLLRRAGAGASPAEVQAYNAVLAAAGARLTAQRAAYVLRLEQALGSDPRLAALVPGGCPTLRYAPRPAVPEGATPHDIELLLRRAMEEATGREAARGHALVGPHRDRLVIACGGADLGTFGSSGQQWGALLALKAAKMAVFRGVRGDSPVLLVDDLDAGLDFDRTAAALRIMEGPFQAILASPRVREWPRGAVPTRNLEVASGIIATFSRGPSEGHERPA